jgi:ATP-binding cassette subfamily A (ABC1) protein 3
VKEHLELFAVFKGSNPALINDEVSKMIADLNLKEKTNELSKSLSGG